ncbi:DNA mismatch repair protein MutS [Ceratobasidium sp. AG-Ba]|nr:DNA mismatch repair protein MutS [Ceratobasidium sp. AG-Ba]
MSVHGGNPSIKVTFWIPGYPSGTTTTNLADLSPNLQFLLRADTIFKGESSNSNYPNIVPPLVPFNRMMPGAEELYLGVRWDRGKLKRDDESMAISKELLARVGKPDATSAEMRALRGNFQCGRCTSALPVSWDRLVHHFGREEAQWKLSQLIKEADPELHLVYNRTHSLDPENNQPFAHFLTPEESADRMLQVSTYDMPLMRCLGCVDVGIDSQYLDLHGDFDIDSPILEHLREVHNVSSPIPGFHYREWEWDVTDSDPSDGDVDDESDSEDEIEM